MNPLTSHDLSRFRTGEEAVFRRVVEDYSPRLLAFVRPFAADLDDAHDLLQEMWHRAYEKRRSFSGSGSLLGWLYAVCRTVCLASAERRTARGGLAAGSPLARMLRQRSTRETAEMLGCAEGTVKATLHHALKKLQISTEVWVS